MSDIKASYLQRVAQQTSTGAVKGPVGMTNLPNYTAPKPDLNEEELGEEFTDPYKNLTEDYINKFDGGTNTVDGEKLCTGKLDFKKENGLIAADKVIVEADVVETIETKSGGSSEIDTILGRTVEKTNSIPSYTLNNNAGARKNLTEEQLEKKGISAKTVNNIEDIRKKINAAQELAQKLSEVFSQPSYTPSGSTGGSSRLGEKIEEQIPDQKTGYDNGYEFLSKCR